MRYAQLLPAVAAFAVSGVLAQQITLFENDNYNGRRFSVATSVQNMQYTGFNDLASSMIIRGGTWQVCSDAYYRGRCVTLQPGSYPSLGSMGLNDRVSSFREIGWDTGGGAGGGGGGGGGGPGGSIVLYEGQGLTGRAFSLNAPLNNFDSSGFNDRAESAEVREGTWQLCVDANFQGSCVDLAPGRYPNLGAVSGRVSSARLVGGGGGSPPSHGGGWGGRTRVVLYSGPNFSGQAYTLTTDYLANLDGTGFNDRTSSLRIERGYWLFCTDANFRGECRTIGPGDYGVVPYGLDNRISSARRISEDYPYNAPPNWAR